MNKWRAYFKQNRRAFTPVKSGKHYLTGFTLVELLVVVAIIGILATVVVISYSGAQKKARDARRQSDMSTIEQALNLYYNDLGSYPVHLAGTGPMFCATTVDASTTGLADTLRNSLSSYLPTFPTDPSNPGAGTAAGYAETVHSYFYCQKWG